MTELSKKKFAKFFFEFSCRTFSQQKFVMNHGVESNEFVAPMTFLEYQVLIGAIINEDKHDMSVHFHEFFRKRFFDRMTPESSENVWRDAYTMLYKFIHDPICLITDDDPRFEDLLYRLFIECDSVLFDIRYQGFLNMLPRLPHGSLRRILFQWIRSLSQHHDDTEFHRKLVRVLYHIGLSPVRVSVTAPSTTPFNNPFRIIKPISVDEDSSNHRSSFRGNHHRRYETGIRLTRHQRAHD